MRPPVKEENTKGQTGRATHRGTGSEVRGKGRERGRSLEILSKQLVAQRAGGTYTSWGFLGMSLEVLMRPRGAYEARERIEVRQ